MRILLPIALLIIFRLSASAQVTILDSVKLQLLLKASKADSLHQNYFSAIQHLKQYQHLKDSILNAANKRQMAQLRQRYQVVKKEQEIKAGEKNIGLLTTQNRLMNINLQQAKSIRQIAMIVAIVAVLLLTIIYWQYRNKRKANLKLEHQQITISHKNEVLEHLATQKDDLLDEKELLIKEIHHRVKNNLQVVISLLNTQSAYLNDPGTSAAIRQSQHRMQSISLIHQKLYQSESRALINMKDYATELLMYLQQSFGTGGRIVFKPEIDDIELDVMRAVPIGLILNETVTNAIRHAFPVCNTGCIVISLKCVDGIYLKLGIIDDGTGLPDGFNVNHSQSLGFNLIKSMCRQIGGQLCIQCEQGLQVSVEFPVSVDALLLTANDEISLFDDDATPA